MKVRLQQAQSVLDQIEAIQKQIAERAFDLFKGRGGTLGQALEDWLTAERHTVWKPPVELVEKDGEFLVEAAVGGVSPKDMDVRITPNEVLIQGNGAHQHRPGEVVHFCEFKPGRLFREVHFPKRVDLDHVRAEYRDGLLRIWAPIADKEVRKVELR
jgi:HSP20 family protein